MFEYYLLNKNERATVAPKSKFLQLNTALQYKLSTMRFTILVLAAMVYISDQITFFSSKLRNINIIIRVRWLEELLVVVVLPSFVTMEYLCR